MSESRLRSGVLVACILLAACAATPYQPAAKGYGYAEQRLEDDRYRVTFTGNERTPRQTVQNYLLYRAAELTLERGRDYFIVVDSAVQPVSGRSPGVGVSLGGFRFGGSGGVGVGVGTSTGGERTAYRAHADIVMRSGSKPADDTRAYDARDLKSNLEAAIQTSDRAAQSAGK